VLNHNTRLTHNWDPFSPSLATEDTITAFNKDLDHNRSWDLDACYRDPGRAAMAFECIRLDSKGTRIGLQHFLETWDA